MSGSFWSGFRPDSKILDASCGSGIPITKVLAEVGFGVLSASIEEEKFQGEPERTFYVLGQKA